MTAIREIKLQNNEFKLLRNFIAEHFGIFFEDANQEQLESKLSRLMQKSNHGSFYAYYQHLIQTFYISQSYEDPEFIELINAITNNETYFYREPEALETMVKSLLPEYISRNQKELNILSAACSSGEEAYTIAMILGECMLPADMHVNIFGIDIDPAMIAKAEKGVYSVNSFRSTYEEQYKERFHRYFTFDPQRNFFTVKPSLRSKVDFRRMNLLDLPQMQTLGMFDIIFCRNVLIYFSPQARACVTQNFAEVLKPGGHLFQGHSEMIYDKRFAAVEKNHCVFYQKQELLCA